MAQQPTVRLIVKSTVAGFAVGAILLLGSKPLLSQPLPDSLLDLHLSSDSLNHIFYHPPYAILNDRPYIFDLVLDFEPDEIASVSLFLRTDASQTYQELAMVGKFGRYSQIVPVTQLTGKRLTYFFLVTMQDYALWGYPVGKDGRIQPYVIDLVPPTQEFFQKHYYE